MKTKDWVKIFTPLILAINENQNKDTEEAQKSYNDYTERCDQLYNECKEIISTRMKGFEAPKSYAGWTGNHRFSERLTNAIREASVKYRSVTHALRVQMSLETLPFPLLDSSMFLTVLVAVQKSIFEEITSLDTMKSDLREAEKMARDLQLLDDPMVKIILQSCRDVVSKKSMSEHIGNLAELGAHIRACEELAEKTGCSPISVMMANPTVRALALKVRLSQSEI